MSNHDKQVLLEVKHLKTSFFTDAGEVKAVNDVSYHVNEQEVVAIVGESGCGKSVTQMSVMQLVQIPPGKILGGEILYDGQDLLQLDKKEMRKIRGDQIAMIFQEPMTSLNPVITVGKQLSEVIRTHKQVDKKEAWELGIKALRGVGIPEPEARMKNYPYEMSGGMRQRVMIAVAVACNSRLIIADEPTTALDVTTQAQVMELLMSVVEQMKTSLIVVTHNLGLVTRYADRIYVMYAGRVIESGTTEEIMTRPGHPYTMGLLKAVPRLEAEDDSELVAIQGAPPNLANLPEQCAFLPRCPYACEECRQKTAPELRLIRGDNHYIACHLDVNREERV
ncbi:MAG: ABC transporter ATP-binding protein [Lachnospiraceae bacterium]|nr:ABC transporter ATP-binding protein [Lachnospiraceae bacterium]